MRGAVLYFGLAFVCAAPAQEPVSEAEENAYSLLFRVAAALPPEALASYSAQFTGNTLEQFAVLRAAREYVAQMDKEAQAYKEAVKPTDADRPSIDEAYRQRRQEVIRKGIAALAVLGQSLEPLRVHVKTVANTARNVERGLSYTITWERELTVRGVGVVEDFTPELETKTVVIMTPPDRVLSACDSGESTTGAAVCQVARHAGLNDGKYDFAFHYYRSYWFHKGSFRGWKALN